MLATNDGLRRNHKNLVRQYIECLTALLYVLVITLIAASCGTATQASGSNNGNSLALSGTLPTGTVSQSYNAVLTVNGGISPYQFSVASGVLPPGLSLNPRTGSFSGTPSSPGTYTFEIKVTDSPRLDVGTQQYKVKVGHGHRSIKVSVSPSPITLRSGGNQQFTATVTGTGETAVTWSATAGSIDSNGLYTAPIVQTASNATVTATSQADPTQSASSVVTVNPNQVQALQITTSGLPQGQQGATYSATFTATGGTQPYSWSLTGGSLPPGITLGGTGDLTGTPTSVGTFGLTVTVTDANGKTANGTFSITIMGGSGYDGPAQLPLVTVPSSMADSPAPGAVINVAAGGDLQSALNNAQCGQTIQLQAGATFTGKYTVPAKNCDANHWIIIRTSSPNSALPAEGQRLTPCYAGVGSLQGRPAYNCPDPKNVLAKVQMPSTGKGPFQLADKANFYRFLGLEITRQDGLTGPAVLISTQGTADHIIVDRCWLHGNPQDETSGGFFANGGTYIAVIDSYFNDFHCMALGSCTDAHAVSAGVSNTQDGPYKIQDNFVEASGEGIIFGGGPATMTPTDIEIIGNHFFKPWQWMSGNSPFVAGANGHPFIVKNHLEFKNAARVLVEANLMENVWGGFSQAGFGILLTPKNQGTKTGVYVCPVCQVTDVTIRYTRISHAGGGILLATALAGGSDGAPALAGTRWSLHDLVLDDLSKKYLGGGAAFLVMNGWPKNPLNTVTINHVTAFPDPYGHMLTTGNLETNPSMYGFVYTNNITLAGRYPVWSWGGGSTNCAYKDVPVITISTCYTTYTFQNNAIIAPPTTYPPSSWPDGNFFPASLADVQFVNYNNGNGGDYELQPTSPYKNKGTDGKDLGADIVGLQAALAGVE